MIGHSDYQCSNTAPSNNPDIYGQYNWLRVEYGIDTFITFKLHPLNDMQEEVKSHKLQLMLILNDYPSMEVPTPFFYKILSGFDINIYQM